MTPPPPDDPVADAIRVAVRPIWIAAAFAATPWIGLVGMLLMPGSPGLLGAAALAVPTSAVVWRVAWVLSNAGARWLGSPLSWSMAILVGLFGGRWWSVASCGVGFLVTSVIAFEVGRP